MTAKPRVSLEDVAGELEIEPNEMSFYLNKETGEFYSISDVDMGDFETGDLDEQIEGAYEWRQNEIRRIKEVLTSSDWVQLPSAYQIHDYNIMRDFCYTIENDDVHEDLLHQIRGRGAFGRFKEAIHRHGIAQDWYDYRFEVYKRIARSFLEAEGIPYVEKGEVSDGK